MGASGKGSVRGPWSGELVKDRQVIGDSYSGAIVGANGAVPGNFKRGVKAFDCAMAGSPAALEPAPPPSPRFEQQVISSDDGFLSPPPAHPAAFDRDLSTDAKRLASAVCKNDYMAMFMEKVSLLAAVGPRDFRDLSCCGRSQSPRAYRAPPALARRT